MIVESSPLSAWYLEVVLNAALICTRVMHSGLNEEQRINLVWDFNNPASALKVLKSHKTLYLWAQTSTRHVILSSYPLPDAARAMRPKPSGAV
ncbi:SNF2-like protein [Penicillium sp. CMV-2018d]|nr:SNF2-like protein [Penicillium sp. CMV-2018d]